MRVFFLISYFLLLYQGVIRSPLAGDLLTAQCAELMEGWKVDIVPAYMVKSKVRYPLKSFLKFKVAFSSHALDQTSPL